MGDIRRHPAEVTSDRLADALERWPERFDGHLRDAIGELRFALEQIAAGSTEADPYPDGLPEDLYVDIESTIHQHCGHDGQSDEANDWVTDLMSALTPLIVRALVGGRPAAPTRDQVRSGVLNHLIAHLDSADPVVTPSTVSAVADLATDAVVALLPRPAAPTDRHDDGLVDLLRQLAATQPEHAELLGLAAEEVATLRASRIGLKECIVDLNSELAAAEDALLSRSAAEPPATIDGRDHTTDAQTVIAAYLRTADLPAMRGTWAAMCEDVAAEILSELRAAGLVYDGVAAEPNAEYEALRAAERGFIVAPWTDRQVEALNTWQRERPVHPFTCGKRDDHESEGVLTATREGWVCEEPDCDYAQDWAHDFMAMTAGVAAEPNEGHGDGA